MNEIALPVVSTSKMPARKLVCWHFTIFREVSPAWRYFKAIEDYFDSNKALHVIIQPDRPYLYPYPGRQDSVEHWEDSCNLKEFSIFPIFALLRKKSQEKEAGRNMGTRLYLQWINCSMHSAARLHCSDYLSFLTKTSLNKVHLSPHPSADPPLISPSMSPSVSSSEV